MKIRCPHSRCNLSFRTAIVQESPRMLPSAPDTKPNTSAPGTAGAVWLFGVPIRFHFTFVILLAFIVAAGLGGDQSWLFNMAHLLALSCSVLPQELGHVPVPRRFGIATKEIVLYPIGGVSRMERDPKPSEEFW